MVCIAPSVCLESGPVRGKADGGIARFFGIRYAQPPVGELRWRAPVPPEHTNKVATAFDLPPPCIQPAEDGGVVGEEDCLKLNVWAPALPPDAGLPVLVFLHGGDNISGSSADPAYDGTAWAQRGGVAVTLNYRLGVFGSLSHHSLVTDAGTAGNYGLMDALLALRWVQRNIELFGGDPKQVLLAGQSAGADNACALRASSLSKGLFQSVLLLSSGGCSTVSAATASRTSELAVGSLVCERSANVAECLRQASAEAVSQVPGNSLFAPSNEARYYVTIDGDVLPSSPLTLFASQLSGPPVVMTTTTEEYAPLIPLIYPQEVTDDAALTTAFVTLFGPQIAAAVRPVYPVAAYPKAEWALIAAVGDYVFQCPNRRLLRSLADAGVSSYRGIFAQTPSDPQWAPYGAAHGFDVPYLFGHFPNRTTNSDEQRLAEQTVEAYRALARFGTPGVVENVSWPAPPQAMALMSPPSLVTGFRDKQCDAWEAAGLP